MIIQVFIIMKSKIYYLKCPITNEVRYVGQTISRLHSRMKNHIHETNRNKKLGKKLTHKENWILSLKDNGLLNEMTICLIEEVDVNDANDREIYWIDFHKSDKLTNTDEGGKRKFLSEESKQKISKANSGSKNGMYGKRYKLSAEQIEINRQSMINSEKFQKSRKSKSFRDKISKSQKVDDWYLLDENFNILKVFEFSKEVASYLGCGKSNVQHARADKRKLSKKYWVCYKKDYYTTKNELIDGKGI